MENPQENGPRYFYQVRKWHIGAEGVALVVALVLALTLLTMAAVNIGEGALTSMLTNRILPTALLVALMAIPMSLIVASGNFDLSIGGVISITVALIGLAEQRVLPAIIGALFIALLVGAINGLVVALTRFNGTVVTFVSFIILSGLSRSLFGDFTGTSLNFPLLESAPQSILLWFLLALLIIAATGLVYFTPFGNRPRRDDPLEPTGKRIIFVGLPYVATSVFAVISGVILVGMLRIAMPQIGTNIEIDVLTAVLVGGTALGAGVAFIPGAVIGAFAVTALSFVTVILGIEPGLGQLFEGLFLLIVFLWATVFHWGTNRFFQRRTAKSGETTADNSTSEALDETTAPTE